jgi:hypothetical protein
MERRVVAQPTSSTTNFTSTGGGESLTEDFRLTRSDGVKSRQDSQE